MIKVVSSKYFLIGVIIIIFSLTIGGDIPNMLFRIWLIAGFLALATLISYTSKIKYTFMIDKEEIDAGETVSMRYRFFNHSKSIPANYVEVSHDMKINNKDEIFTNTSSIPPLDEFLFEKNIKMKKRGIYDLGKCNLKTRDVFGIFEIQKNFNPKVTLTVLPKVFEIREIKIPPSENYGPEQRNNSLSDDYTTIDKIRKYLPGDSHKKINYKITARFSEIFINEFESYSRSSAVLFLDGFKQGYLSDKEGEVEDKLIEMISSMAKFFVKRKVPVLYMDSTAKRKYMEIKSSYDFKTLLNELAGFTPDGNIHLDKIFDVASGDLIDRKSIFIFSPFVDYEMLNRFYSLKKKGYSITSITAGEYHDRLKYESLLVQDGIWPVNIGINQSILEVFNNRR